MQHGYEFVTISIWLCRYFFTMCIDHVKPYTMVGTIWEMTTVIILTTLSLLSISQIIIHGNDVSVTSKYTTVSPGIRLIDTANLKSFFFKLHFPLSISFWRKTYNARRIFDVHSLRAAYNCRQFAFYVRLSLRRHQIAHQVAFVDRSPAIYIEWTFIVGTRGSKGDGSDNEFT